MSRGYSFVFFRIVCLIIIISGTSFVVSSASQAFAQAMADVEMISPKPGTEIIAKRPEIVCRAPAFDTLENVMIFFDGADVTGIIIATPEGFSFTPVEILNPGPHVLTVIMTRADGNPEQSEFSFSTRHSKLFEEAAAKNDLSLSYEKTAEKPDEATEQNSYKLESNIGHESVIREQAWETRFNSNLRYLAMSPYH